MNAGDQHRTSEADGSRLTLVELSSRAGRGDEGAFAALHRRVGAGLRRMLLKRCHGREDVVEDLSQKTWAAVWKSLSENKYDPSRAAITTFVYAVGHNAWLTHLRQLGRAQQLNESVGNEAAAATTQPAATRERGASALLAEAEMIESVRACLRDARTAGMTDLERTIVHAIALGEGDRQLARRMGMSGSTINKHKHSGYAKIRTYLASRGFAELPEASAGQPGADARGAGSAGFDDRNGGEP